MPYTPNGAWQGRSRLKALLAARGMRFTWAAKQLGVSYHMFNHYEIGDRKAPPGYYERAAMLLGVPVEDVLPAEAAVA